MTELDDRELLADLQKLVQSGQPAPTPKQSKEAQLLAAAQIDQLCLSFERQKNELLKRRREITRDIQKDNIPGRNTKDDWIAAREVYRATLTRYSKDGTSKSELQLWKNWLAEAQEIVKAFEDIDSQISPIDQRIARYRELADKLLKGL